MQKKKGYFVSSVVLVTLLMGVLGASFVFARGSISSVASANSASSAQPAIAPMLGMQTVNMQSVPAANTASLTSSLNHPAKMMPLLTGNPTLYAQHKAAATHNTNAPFANSAISNAAPKAASATTASTPTTTTQFQGMADSKSICPPAGCQPPDMALAASPSWVFQGVNTAFAIYSSTGVLQKGWPKTAQKFFGIPNPGSCDKTGPFLTDPRTFYDPVDKRFWAAILQVEGAFGINKCPFQSLYWIAVSKSSNPNGVWNIYNFDMARGTKNGVDFTEFGFDRQAVYFSGNMFDRASSMFQYAEVFAASKARMEAGKSVTARGFMKLQSGTTMVDTVQPTMMEASGSSSNPAPGAELLVSSFNINSGQGQCFSGCSGIVVWAFDNPLIDPTLSQVVVSTPSYTLAPQADEPGCNVCIETSDTRISGAPVYNNGKISFALETGVDNGTQVVPGIFWGQIQPTLSSGTIVSASLVQSGYLAFSGDQAASFGALMSDNADNLFMVFDTMSATLNPSIMYTARQTSDPLGQFESAQMLIQGVIPTNNNRWGDYEAAAFDGPTTNHVWLAAQYSGSTGDWATYIAQVHF